MKGDSWITLSLKPEESEQTQKHRLPSERPASFYLFKQNQSPRKASNKEYNLCVGGQLQLVGCHYAMKIVLFSLVSLAVSIESSRG